MKSTNDAEEEMEYPAVKRWIEFLEADAKKWEVAAQMCDEQAADLHDDEWTRQSAKECHDMIAEFRNADN